MPQHGEQLLCLSRETLNSLGPQTHGVTDKQTVSRAVQGPSDTPLPRRRRRRPEDCPMTHFPNDKSILGLVGWRAIGAGRNSPSWGYVRLLSDTPWHGQASPSSWVRDIAPSVPGHGTFVFFANGQVPSGESQPPHPRGPQLALQLGI